MAIRLDEARLRLLKMCGELSPSINNTYNIGTSSLKFANVYATTFHGALDGNANTATALTSSAGSSTLPIYFSDGKPIAITGTIANSISGNAATATKFNSNRAITLTGAITGTYSSDGASGWSIPTEIAGATIDNNFSTKYRTQIKGDTNRGNFLKVIRNDTASVSNSPQYGSGLGWGMGDTHGYLYVNYSSAGAYLGGGNVNKLNWTKKIAFADGTGASGNWGINITGNAATASLLKNVGSRCTAKSSTWNNARGGTIVWGLGWTSTNYTYTPSGGSATTITDSGDISFYIKAGSTTSNSLLLNMAIDGEIYAGGGFIGNASTATKLATARTISLTGSVTGSGTFDGSGNLSIATTTNHNHSLILDSGNSNSTTFAYSKAGLNYSDYTWLAAWNGYELRGVNKSQFALASHTHKYAGSSSAGGSATSAVKLDTATAGSTTQPVYFSGGKPIAITGTIANSTSGNAATATKLLTARKINGVSFNGSANITFKGNYVSNTAYHTIPVGISYIEMPSTATVAGDPTYGTMLSVFINSARAFLLVGDSDGNLFARGLHSGNSSDAGTGYGPWRRMLHDGNYTSYTVTKTGSGASGTWGINITGSATTAQYPAGFSSSTLGSTWGNTIGTSITCWNDPTGGSVDWRRDNPSSGKISMKVDGRVYVNEGSNPVMGMNTSSGFWGMGDPDGNSSNWIRTTSSGIIPYSSGGASALGTKTWPFNTIWSKSLNIIDTYWPSFNLISLTANSKGTYSKGMVEVNYSDSIGMWIHSNKATDAKSRRALVLYGYGQKADASEAIALRLCDTSGTWLSDLYLLHSGNYNSYALPLSGGIISGRIGWSGASAVINSLTSSNYTQGMMIDVGMNGSGIYKGNGDNATTGTSGAANIIIKSWYGVGFATSCYTLTNQGITLNINTRTGDLNTIGKVYGAVWNDYAEYRSTEPIQPGRVVREDKDGIMKLTTERLMPACEIISDTFGFAIGKTDESKTPIAATGRVLAYTYEDRYSFELGDAVCSGPNGTVSKMTRQELMMYPERMIGTVSEIPEYKTWGSGNVEVDERIWIRVR